MRCIVSCKGTRQRNTWTQKQIKRLHPWVHGKDFHSMCKVLKRTASLKSRSSHLSQVTVFLRETVAKRNRDRETDTDTDTWFVGKATNLYRRREVRQDYGMWICVCMHSWVCTCLCLCVCACAHVHTCMCKCVHAWMCVCALLQN